MLRFQWYLQKELLLRIDFLKLRCCSRHLREPEEAPRTISCYLFLRCFLNVMCETSCVGTPGGPNVLKLHTSLYSRPPSPFDPSFFKGPPLGPPNGGSRTDLDFDDVFSMCAECHLPKPLLETSFEFVFGSPSTSSFHA